MEGDMTSVSSHQQQQTLNAIQSYIATFNKEIVEDGSGAGGFESSILNSQSATHGSDGPHFALQNVQSIQVGGQTFLAQNADGQFYQTGFYHVTEEQPVASYGNDSARLTYSEADRTYTAAAAQSIIYPSDAMTVSLAQINRSNVVAPGTSVIASAAQASLMRSNQPMASLPRHTTVSGGLSGTSVSAGGVVTTAKRATAPTLLKMTTATASAARGPASAVTTGRVQSLQIVSADGSKLKAGTSAPSSVAVLNTGDNNYQTVTIMPSSQVSSSEEQTVSYVLIVSQPHEGIDGGAADLSVYDFKEEQLRREGDPADGDDKDDEDDEEQDDDDDEKSSTHGERPAGADSNTCTYCDYTSPKRYLLSRHMRTHSEDRPHKCSICERAFKTLASLHNHINTHTGTRPHKCKDCDSAFTTSGELVRHMRYRHTFEKPHKCTEPGCDYSSVELSKLKRHVRSHTGERPYQCPNCAYASPDTYKLKRHLRIHTGEKPYVCDICHARFTQSNSLKAHKLIHSGNKPVFQCDLCPTTCGRKTDLKIHVQKLHTSDKPLQCKKCSKYFPDRYTYKLHLKTHDGEKCFKCGLCAYAALSERHLQTHILTQHHQDKPHECAECGEAFRHRPLLRRHKIFVHGAEDFQPRERHYSCAECGKSFVMEGNYQKHLLYHDPEADCYNNDEFVGELEAIDEIGETFDEGDEAEAARKQQRASDSVRQMIQEMESENLVMRRIVKEVDGHRVVVMEVGPATAMLSGALDDSEVKSTTLVPAMVSSRGGGLSLDYMGRRGGGVGGGPAAGLSSGGVELLTEGAVQMLYDIVDTQTDENCASITQSGNVVTVQITEAAAIGASGKSDEQLPHIASDLLVAAASAGLQASSGQSAVGRRGAKNEDGSSDETSGNQSSYQSPTAEVARMLRQKRKGNEQEGAAPNKMSGVEDRKVQKEKAKLDECFSFDEDA